MLDRWARMLSSVEPGSRIGLYFTRGPLAIESGGSDPGDNVGAIARRRRGEFLTARVQETGTHIVWCHNPGLQQTRSNSGTGPWWMEYARSWLARQRAPHESVYLHNQVEAAAERFRQGVEASRAMIDDLTPVEVLDGRAGAMP